MMHTRLSVRQKYRLCQLVFILGFVAALYFLSHMSPYAAPHHNKVMFTMLMISVVGCLPFALGFYYYRSRLHDVETGQIQVETLAHVGEKQQQGDDGTAKDKIA